MKKRMMLAAFLALAAAHVEAQVLTEPLLQRCASATEGQSTQPWVNCSGGVTFGPVSQGGMVATGSFSAGDWRDFSLLPEEVLVAVCPVGAQIVAPNRCRTADDTAWATRFVAKRALAPVGPMLRLTWRWPPVTTFFDGTPLPTGAAVSYVVMWRSADGTVGQADTDTNMAVTDVPFQRTCATVQALFMGVLSDPSEERCTIVKPGTPTNVTVEFGKPEEVQ